MKFKNRRLSVGMSKTINTGNYESMRINASIEVDVSDNQDLDEAYDELYEECTKQVLLQEEQVIGG